jgi:aldehyde dehydrogenase (NAD+)
MPLVKQETFGPLLHVLTIDSIDDAIAVNNDSDHGLSAAIFTRDLRAAERFVDGADCGLCNVNTGTSGAEIGGAFGGEKDTGGGRESGSDSWKQYMRRQSSAVNYGDALPLAQGVRFDVT